MPRPTSLTPDTQARVVEAIKQGATYELAAKFAGISYDTFNNWRKRGRAELERLQNPNTKPRDKEARYVQFFEAVEKAEGDATVHWLAIIQKAAFGGNWQAAAWKLERRYYRAYGRQAHTVEHEGKIAFELSFDDD